MAVDHAALEYSAKSGNRIRWLTFEANMTNLPDNGDDRFLVPCHGYFYTDHMKDKGAITHRYSGGGNYEVSSNYFSDMGGSDSYITVPTGEWEDRWLGTTDGFTTEAIANDGNSYPNRLGDAVSPPHDYFEEIDFMAEVQYSNSMDLDFVNKNDNRIILTWVGTEDGVVRPADALNFEGGGNGYYARIDQGQDSWGRYWFYFGLEP